MLMTPLTFCGNQFHLLNHTPAFLASFDSSQDILIIETFPAPRETKHLKILYEFEEIYALRALSLTRPKVTTGTFINSNTDGMGSGDPSAIFLDR